MKLKKISFVFFCLMLGASCTLDLQENPNAVNPDQGVPNLLLNSIQRQFAALHSAASGVGATLTRQANAAGSTYANTISPNGFDGIWNTAYAGILEDGVTLITLADQNGYARHAGMARIFNAFTMLMLVDMFGDVPYTTAFQGDDNFNPSVDGGLATYNAVIALLDKAIIDLTTPATNAIPAGYLNPIAPSPEDQYYYGGLAKWVKLANSLKLKAFLNLRESDPTGATAGINAAITGGLILAANENFFFHYGISTSDPDARHPLFVNNYPAGGGNYMSNWLMWQMFHGYDATQNGQPGDPRIRFYFYRQRTTNNTDPNNIRCVTNLLAPAHYPQKIGSAIVLNGTAGHPVGISTDPNAVAWSTNGSGSAGNLPRTFCYPSDRGYWGRDHVDPQGIPPDANLRTAWGVYPAGGRYDSDAITGTLRNVRADAGMRGAGIQPIMMRSFVNFMLAEAVLYLPGVVGAPTAAVAFETGMRNSFDDVREFSTTGTISGTGHPAGPNENTTIALTPPNSVAGISSAYPSGTYNTDRDNYILHAVGAGGVTDLGGALTQFNLASTPDAKMDFVAREYWIASFGNGVEAYNLYRRTGMPSGMQPTIQATTASSPFPRSYYYPQAFAALNSTVVQKTTLSEKVFWDMNTTNLDF